MQIMHLHLTPSLDRDEECMRWGVYEAESVSWWGVYEAGSAQEVRSVWGRECMYEVGSMRWAMYIEPRGIFKDP